MRTSNLEVGGSVYVQLGVNDTTLLAGLHGSCADLKDK